ncbi:HAD family hydrolase [bacterium]|nr:HAD family hydrolase [bacterium]MBU1958458.1 HAD family hydrolase [bacterium]
MKQFIIFDMDGTLVDSSLTIVNAINTVRKNLSLEPMDEKEILEKVNDPHLNPALYFYEAKAFTPEHEEWFATYYTNHHEEELRLYDGTEKLLKELKNQGFKLAVATNAYRVSTLQSLSHLNVLQYFDGIVCYDDVAHGKPQPDMLEKLLNDLNISIKTSLFIGDSNRDKLAAEAINMDYLMVNWGFSNHDDAIHSIEKLQKSIVEF